MNGSPQLFVYFLPYEREQEVHKCIYPKHFRASGIKISNVMTKETSQMIAADTVALPCQQSLLSDLSRKIEGDAGYCGTYGTSK